jgi:hypothetical protein
MAFVLWRAQFADFFHFHFHFALSSLFIEAANAIEAGCGGTSRLIHVKRAASTHA